MNEDDPRARFLTSALTQIREQIDDDATLISLLVGTRSPAGEEIHYYVLAERPGVRRVLMLPDSDEAAQARDLLAAASVRLDAPDTPDGG